MPLPNFEATSVLTRSLIWVGLALVVYFLLTRLRTLTILSATRRGLSEASIIQVRRSRLIVEGVIVVVVLGWWGAGVAARGSFGWDIGGSGSPLHATVTGVWFVVGAALVALATALVLVFTAKLASDRALDLRDDFPRSAGCQTHVLRLALMNPRIVFISSRRSPVLWMWTEIRAAALGVVMTLAAEGLADELPATRGQLDDTIDEVDDGFEIDERVAGRRRALTWNELPRRLAAITDTVPAHDYPLVLPPSDVPLDARSIGYWTGILSGVMSNRRRTKRVESRSHFDEQGSVETILEAAPGPISDAIRERGVEEFVSMVRSTVMLDLRDRLSDRRRRQLDKAFREEARAGAAAWMIEKIPGYTAMFRECARAEVDKMTHVIDGVMAGLEEPRDTQVEPDSSV